jgi:group I intron endonuclease
MVIYKTTNLVNGKYYVGKDAANNPLYLGSGLLISQAIKKYGKENFKKEILESCITIEYLNEREKYWIKTLNATNRKIAYNLTEGGSGGPTWMYSPRKKELLKIFQDAGKKFSQSKEGREFLSENSKRIWKNPLHKKRMIEALTGREIKWKDKISKSIKKWHKTNPISAETRKRIGAINKIKMTGKEFKVVSDVDKKKIINLYYQFGPKTISKVLKQEGILVSPYLIIRILKKEGVYQKWQKGIDKN